MNNFETDFGLHNLQNIKYALIITSTVQKSYTDRAGNCLFLLWAERSRDNQIAYCFLNLDDMAPGTYWSRWCQFMENIGRCSLLESLF